MTAERPARVSQLAAAAFASASVCFVAGVASLATIGSAVVDPGTRLSLGVLALFGGVGDLVLSLVVLIRVLVKHKDLRGRRYAIGGVVLSGLAIFCGVLLAIGAALSTG